MKKFFLALCALIVGMAANATDYYLIGGFNNWTLKAQNCLFTAAEDGTYVLDYEGILTSGFKINDGTWSNDKANFGSNGTALQLDQPYTMKVGGDTKNIALTENIANPHLVLNVSNPSNPVLTISGQSQEAEYKYGIKGQIFDGENWNVVDMVENEDNGKWVLTAEVVAGEFGVLVMDASTSAQTAWFAADGDGVLGTAQLGQPLALKENGTNFASTLAGTFTFVFDPNAMTLTVVGEETPVDPDPVDPDPVDPVYTYAIHGSVFTGSWESRGMDKGENGTWILTSTLQAGEFGIKKIDADGNQAGWIAAQSGYAEAVVGIAMTAATENNTNWVSTLEGEYTFVFDPTAMTLTIQGETPVDPDPVDPDPVDPVLPAHVYIVGTLAGGNWATATAPELTFAEDTKLFTIENVEIKASSDDTTTGYFTFITVQGADWNATNGGDRYGAPEKDVLLTVPSTTNVTLFKAGVNASAANSWKVEAGYYDIVLDLANMTISIKGEDTPVDPDPVEPDPVDPVYSYGLHGSVFTGSWETREMTKAEDGTWTLTATLQAGEFGIMPLKDGKQDNNGWIAAANGMTEAVVGIAMTATSENSSNWVSTLTGEYTFVFNPTEMTLTIKGDAPVDPDPVDPDPVDPVLPEHVYIVGTLAGGNWATATAPELTFSDDTKLFTIENVEIKASSDDATTGYFTFITVQGSDWDTEVNNGDRYGAPTKDAELSVPSTTEVTLFKAGVNASSANSWKVEAGCYDIVLDLTNMTIAISSADTPVDPDPVDPDPVDPVLPEHVYIVGTLGSGEWDTANAPEVARIEGTNTFKIENVQIVAASADTSMGYFTFITKQGADWDAVNGGDRYGASSKDEAISVPGTASMTKYAVGVNASAAESWMVEAEYYDITLDFDNMTVNVIKSFESNLSIDTEENEPTYYNMEGVQVEYPVSGFYIEVRGNQVRKVVIK